jgi:hypothetical protein
MGRFLTREIETEETSLRSHNKTWQIYMFFLASLVSLSIELRRERMIAMID